MATDTQFTLAAKYLPLMDEVYKRESLTAILDTPNNRIKFMDGDTVKIWKISPTGLGTYGRNSGYAAGAVTGSWELFTLACDRGRKFLIDVMSNEETLGMALGSTVGEFQRTQSIPEVDAYRFAKYAAAAGASASAAITAGTTDVPGLIDAGTEYLDDNEVSREGRVLFVSAKAYHGLKAKISRTLVNEGNVAKAVEMYDNMRVVVVPSNRFYTAVTLNAGADASAGGYAGTSGAHKINFMIVDPKAVIQTVKRNDSTIIAPEYNNDADGYIFKYRLYHDAFVMDNKVNGIYLHYDPVALT